jgi:type III pantothenate kinase
LQVTEAAVASVVPSITDAVCETIEKRFDVKVLVVGRDFHVKMENLCAVPERVGADRLLNALAAFDRARGPCVIVDAGSAITVDAVDEKGRFLGGAIAPGPELQALALHEHTALLPLAPFAKPQSALGRNTEQSIQSGIYWGSLGAIVELVRQISPLAGEHAQLFATGGHGQLLVSETMGIMTSDPHLTLRGIRLAYEARHR